MKKSLISRYLPAFLLLLAGTVLLFSVFITRSMSNTLTAMYHANIARTADLVGAVLFSRDDAPDFEKMTNRFAFREMSVRLSIIRPDGVVAADSHYDISLLDNHADRPEVRRALAGTPTYSVRRSDTLKLDMLYYALPVLQSGEIAWVIRTSVPMQDITAVRRTIRSSVSVIGLIILSIASIFSLLIHRRTSEPLERIRIAANHYAKGELEYPLTIDGPPGIRDMAEDMRSMARELITRINLMTRQRNELEAVFSSMVEAVLVLDENLVIKAINPAACSLAGYPREEALNRLLIEVFRNSELRDFAADILSERQPMEREIVFSMPVVTGKPVHGGRRERFLQVHGSIFKKGNLGQIDTVSHYRILLVLHDISELKRLEQIRKDFVANVSHELKTPITSLKGYVETLLDGAIDEKETAVEFLRVVASQTERINAIVSDLLSLSRLEQGGAALETEDVPIRGMVESALRVCRRKAEERNIRLELVCPDDIMIHVNSLLIEQALVNLVDNAIKYSENDARVMVRVEKRDGILSVAVEDSGCGIPEKDIPRLFERFYRVDRARSRELGGTGLGLAIVKHIAWAHKGDVSVESAEGAGSVFTISIPLGPEDQ